MKFFSLKKLIAESFRKEKLCRLSKKQEPRERKLTEIIQDGGQLVIEDESTSHLVEMLKAERGLPAIVSLSEYNQNWILFSSFSH